MQHLGEGLHYRLRKCPSLCSRANEGVRANELYCFAEVCLGLLGKTCIAGAACKCRLLWRQTALSLLPALVDDALQNM